MRIRGEELFKRTDDFRKNEAIAAPCLWYSEEKNGIYLIVTSLRHRFSRGKYSMEELYIIEGSSSYEETKTLPRGLKYIGALT